jgi:hypothetical protein
MRHQKPNTDEITKPRALPPDFVAGLPSFCAPISAEDEPSVAVWVDFWSVRPLGDPEVDYVRGQAYAAEAIWYAQVEKSQPEWLDVFITWMMFCCFEEGRPPGPLELGFLDEIRRTAPETFGRMTARIYEQYPCLRN